LKNILRNDNLKKYNILFRISGGRAKNKELGMGHIYRAMNLSANLKSHNLFFLVEDYGGAINVLKQNGFSNIKKLKPKIELSDDISTTKNIVNLNAIDVIIVDKFDSTTKKYVKYCKNFSKIVVIPDVDKIDYDADLVINGFIGFKNSEIRNRYNTKCLLGPKYQILNKQYFSVSTRIPKKFTLLATFGGFDANNIIPRFCKSLKPFQYFFKTKIILGPATKKSKLQSIKLDKNQVSIIHKTKNMKNEILQAKYGICSGGITTYEFANLGIPFATICQYPHQQKTAKSWKSYGLTMNLGSLDKSFEKRLNIFLRKIASDKFNLKTNPNLVDGLGSKRVSKEVLSILK